MPISVNGEAPFSKCFLSTKKRKVGISKLLRFEEHFKKIVRTVGLAVTVKLGSWGGAVARALASNQCGLGSIPGPGVICGLILLLVLALAPRVFSGFSGFPPPSKINISKFQFDREFEGHGFVSRRLSCATLVKESQFIELVISKA